MLTTLGRYQRVNCTLIRNVVIHLNRCLPDFLGVTLQQSSYVPNLLLSYPLLHTYLRPLRICHLKVMLTWEQFPWKHISHSSAVLFLVFAPHTAFFFFFFWDPEICSILWACILTILQEASIKVWCVCLSALFWSLTNGLRVIGLEKMNSVENHGQAGLTYFRGLAGPVQFICTCIWNYV